MSYFDDPKNVEDYVKMAEGYDGRELIAILRGYLAPGATVLELGMGPGTDFELLQEYYQVTGSDYSAAFLARYQQKNPGADLVQLDAVTMAIARKFDAIYSNKVLHHLSRADLKRSLQRQAAVLNDQGVLLHSFWAGDTDENIHGLQFAYYTEETLRQAIGNEYEVLEFTPYSEMADNDSLVAVLRKTTSRGQS